MAKYSCLAAAKLVELTTSGKEETARKACLDIIAPPTLTAKKTRTPAEQQGTADKQTPQLSPQTASKLLAALAEEKEDG